MIGREGGGREEGEGEVRNEGRGTYPRAGRQRKGVVGIALVTVPGGGRWRGLIVVVVVVFVICPHRALLVVRCGTLS